MYLYISNNSSYVELNLLTECMSYKSTPHIHVSYVLSTNSGPVVPVTRASDHTLGMCHFRSRSWTASTASTTFSSTYSELIPKEKAGHARFAAILRTRYVSLEVWIVAEVTYRVVSETARTETRFSPRSAHTIPLSTAYCCTVTGLRFTRAVLLQIT